MNTRILKYQHISPGTNVRVYDHRDLDVSSFFEGIVLEHKKLTGGLKVLAVECNYDSNSECGTCYCSNGDSCIGCRVGKRIPVPMEILNDFDGRVKVVLVSARFVA